MLLVHPSSQCDVCLDAYWSTTTKVPHVIQCGHVFCLDCLRTVNPSNCPMCRKAFNPERIKKLHIDKASSDGPLFSGPLFEENELLRRVGLLFAEDVDEEDVNSLVEEVTEWLTSNPGPSHRALRNACTALHQYKALQMQKAVDTEMIERLRVTHERHAHVKQKDLDISMAVERNMLLQLEQTREEYEAKVASAEAEVTALRERIAHLQTELHRYTTSPNPLPRPPEIVPLITSLTTHEPAARPNPSAERSVVPLGLGDPPTTVAAPATQSRSSSGSSGRSRGAAASVHFADPPPRDFQSKHKVTPDGEELRQENTRRPHLIVPGAPPSQRVIPPRLDSLDSDVTPRPSFVPYRPSSAEMAARRAYLLQADAVVWVGDQDAEHEIFPNEVPLESVLQQYRSADPNPVNSMIRPVSSLAVTPAGSSLVPPVIPPPPVPATMIAPPMTARPAAETGSARIRIPPPDVPVSGRSPLGWRPGPAHKPGHVPAYLPEIGITWIPEEQAAKLPVRARGTESRYAYVIAKDPSEVDDDWRRIHDGASPGPNPLQLIGVPEAAVAGPSRSVVQRGQFDPGPSAIVSTLFANSLGASDRTVAASAIHSSTLFSNADILAPITSSARPNRASTRRRAASVANDPLGLNITSLSEAERPIPTQVPEVPEAQPSPASTWGTIPTVSSRNSSLGNLHLNNFPSPHPFAHTTESLEELPIGELNGGPIVLTEAISAVTPRQAPSLSGDARSVSSRSISSRSSGASGNLPGLLLDPSAGSSRQVVSSLGDLENVNRSLLQLVSPNERAVERDVRSEPSRASRHSSRHSRQHSVSASGDEAEGAMVGLRTGITLYSSRPVTSYVTDHSSNEPLSADPSPAAAQSRPRSGASARSYAESTHSYHSHSSHSARSHHSSQSSVSRKSSDASRSRRGSTTFALGPSHNTESTGWMSEPSDTQPYGPSHGPYQCDYRPQQSQESIPRSLGGSLQSLGLGFGSSLGLTDEPASTSSAVTRNGEAAAHIIAPAPRSTRRSSISWNSLNSRTGH